MYIDIKKSKSFIQCYMYNVYYVHKYFGIMLCAKINFDSSFVLRVDIF